jgi:hypothetical protein
VVVKAPALASAKKNKYLSLTALVVVNSVVYVFVGSELAVVVALWALNVTVLFVVAPSAGGGQSHILKPQSKVFPFCTLKVTRALTFLLSSGT